MSLVNGLLNVCLIPFPKTDRLLLKRDGTKRNIRSCLLNHLTFDDRTKGVVPKIFTIGLLRTFTHHLPITKDGDTRRRNELNAAIIAALKLRERIEDRIAADTEVEVIRIDHACHHDADDLAIAVEDRTARASWIEWDRV